MIWVRTERLMQGKPLTFCSGCLAVVAIVSVDNLWAFVTTGGPLCDPKRFSAARLCGSMRGSDSCLALSLLA